MKFVMILASLVISLGATAKPSSFHSQPEPRYEGDWVVTPDDQVDKIKEIRPGHQAVMLNSGKTFSFLQLVPEVMQTNRLSIGRSVETKTGETIVVERAFADGRIATKDKKVYHPEQLKLKVAKMKGFVTGQTVITPVGEVRQIVHVHSNGAILLNSSSYFEASELEIFDACQSALLAAE